MPDIIKIIIVEDHPIFRMGMKELINREKDLEVVGDAETVAEALDLIEIQPPDLVIVDLSLKESNGIELVKEIQHNYKNIASLVLSMHDEALHAERCLTAGARGYIMKHEASESVVKAIRHIIAGNIYVSPGIMSTILNKFQNKPDPVSASPLKRLTDRELEIFRLIGQGLSSKEIAVQLAISIKTVGTYRERIKEKLNLKNSGELLRHAVIWVETGR
ncbi:MAG: DNA-binding response regulator [Deltaproteobacteria bacterium RIFOXYC2_FULL_48_10]|nr:MAG: DNA-binding response regulator [Deltaproteobacteria bacterium RIFOXYC2_FULL_48_10]